MSNVVAGIVRGQLGGLPIRIKQRRAVFEKYCQGFARILGIKPQAEAQWNSESRILAMPREGGREEVNTAQALANESVSKCATRVVDSLRKATISANNGVQTRGGDESGENSLGEAVSRHTRWLSCFLIDEKAFGMGAADLIRFLDSANVEARPVWKPMHTQPLYRACESIGGELAETLHRQGICLPSSSSLSEQEQQFVIQCVKEAHQMANATPPLEK